MYLISFWCKLFFLWPLSKVLREKKYFKWNNFKSILLIKKRPKIFLSTNCIVLRWTTTLPTGLKTTTRQTVARSRNNSHGRDDQGCYCKASYFIITTIWCCCCCCKTKIKVTGVISSDGISGRYSLKHRKS